MGMGLGSEGLMGRGPQLGAVSLPGPGESSVAGVWQHFTLVAICQGEAQSTLVFSSGVLELEDNSESISLILQQ